MLFCVAIIISWPSSSIAFYIISRVFASSISFVQSFKQNALHWILNNRVCLIKRFAKFIFIRLCQLFHWNEKGGSHTKPHLIFSHHCWKCHVLNRQCNTINANTKQINYFNFSTNFHQIIKPSIWQKSAFYVIIYIQMKHGSN